MSEENKQDDDFVRKIQELNFSYLSLAKEMIKADKEKAIVRLGITHEQALLLEAMTNSQVMKFCRSNILIPKLSHVETALMKTAITQNNWFIPHKVHSSIVLSENKEEM